MFTYLSNSWLGLYIQKCSKLELVNCLAPAPNPAYHLAWKHNFLALSLLFCLCQSLGFQRLHWKLPHSPYGSQSKTFTIRVYTEGFYESWSEPLGQWLISEWEHKLLLVNRLWWRCYIALERQTRVRQSVHSWMVAMNERQSTRDGRGDAYQANSGEEQNPWNVCICYKNGFTRLFYMVELDNSTMPCLCSGKTENHVAMQTTK